MKSKRLLFGLFSVLAFALFSSVPSTALGAAFNYQPLEKIPGAKGVSSFPDYIQGIYKFGIWTVGLAALFMLSVGGFIYLSSGGNTATISKAKTYIWDAIIGLALALLAYLILYVINPDLVNVNLGRFSQVGGNLPINVSVPEGTTAVAPVVNNAYKAGMTPSNVADCTTLAGTAWPSDATERAAITPVTAKPDNCAKVGSSGCTSLSGMPNSALSLLQNLGAECLAFNSKCKIVVTGGTEYWLHGNNCQKATYHKPGNPVFDIGKGSSSAEFTDPTNGYLAKKGSYVCTYKSGGAVYALPVATSTGTKNIYLWDEDSSHWHASIYDMCH